MRLFDSLDHLPEGFPERPTCLAIGVFDGLHLGHRSLIGRAVGRARDIGGLSGVLTFKKHPLALLAPPYEPPRLIALERRRELLAAMGLDFLAEVEFTREFASVEAEAFVRDLLKGRLDIAEIACGSNHRFGREGKGDPALLRRLGEELGFSLWLAPEACLDNAPVSSTAVRDWLLRGNVEDARRALGRPYELRGKVVEGDKRGRLLGFPTANLAPVERLLAPGRGVYACFAEVPTGEGNSTQFFPAMANIGSRPTFQGRDDRVEAHLLGFEGDLYGQEIGLRFVKRLRDEKRFDGPGSIKAQLAQDAEQARDALALETP